MLPEPSNYAICYDAIQRVYRNAIIRAARRALKESYGDDWLKRVEEVFQREWQGVVDAANQIRVAGFVGASLTDDFDCLGVNHFHNLFAKFFNEIFPRSDKVSDIVREEERRAVLRFAKEVNDYRNAMSHPSESDLPRRDAIRLLDSACRLLTKIDQDAAKKIIEHERRLVSDSPIPPAIVPSPPFVVAPTPTLGRRSNQRQQKDTMIQDVNRLNASIYLDDYMYVGGRRMLAAPKYFAPYFSQECTNLAGGFGIRMYSRVLHSPEISLADLWKLDADGIEQIVQFEPHRDRWKRGLRRIVDRARRDPFSADHDPHRLYFLDAPVQLGHVIKKCGRISQIPHGYGTSFARLKDARCVEDLTL